MKLQRVSISGIDESAGIEELLDIHREFPFVEWGLLIHDAPSEPRYPSADWRNRLLTTAGDLAFVAHLEADVFRRILHGEILPDLNLTSYRRVQINIARDMDYLLNLDSHAFGHLPQLDYILQVPYLEGDCMRLPQRMQSMGHDVSLLYDGSWGRGILPEKWPTLPAEFKTGMAGGLSPDNLEEQLAKMADLPGPSVVWIDMETGVRDPRSDAVDPAKVRRCLQIAKDYVVHLAKDHYKENGYVRETSRVL